MSLRTVRLGDISAVGAGQGAPQDRHAFSSQGHPFVRAASLDALCDDGSFRSLERIDESVAKRHRLRLYAPDTVIFAKSGMSATKNRIYRLSRPAYVVNHLATVSPSEQLDSGYLRFWLEHFNPTRLIQDPAYPSISLESIESVSLSLPDLSEQKRIARLLEQADRLRRIRRYALELSDTFLPAAFLELFGDPLTNPRGWKRAKICELAEVQTGNTPPREDVTNYGSAVEWIKSDNISLSELYPTRAAEMLSEKGIALGTVVNGGSVLVTCIAGSATSIGNVCLTNRRVAFNQQINSVTPNRDVLPLFLYGLLLMAKPLIQRSTTLAMKRMITKTKLEELLLIRPPETVQRQFSQLISRHDRLRAGQREALRHAEHLFQALLDQAFRECV